MTVDHLCFNTLCCNPEHLRLLPNLENARRQRSAFKTHCIRGHEFTPENTIRTGGNRRCRECARARYRRRAATKKEKA
jgi:hypothetical protein